MIYGAIKEGSNHKKSIGRKVGDHVPVLLNRAETSASVSRGLNIGVTFLIPLRDAKCESLRFLGDGVW